VEQRENLRIAFDKTPRLSGLLKVYPLRREWSLKRLAIIFGVYTTYVLMLLIQTFFNYKWRGAQPPWALEISYLAVWSYTWALLTPLLFTFSRRYPIARKHTIRNIVYHFFFGIVLVTIHRTILLSFAILILEAPAPPIGDSLSAKLFFMLHHISDGLFTYTFILAIHQAFLYFRESQDREFQLQQAELQTLKTQLHPHFLFNTLNAIAALVYVSPPAATRTISQLSDLLRFTLHNNKTQEVTLKEELDFLRKYLQIQQTLLQERLDVDWAIDPETLDALVPNMILQPLVENSIRHGIAPKEGGGRIEIFSRRVNDQLLLEIRDDGVGAPSITKKGAGIGLTNSRTRLEHLYGEAQKFDVKTPAHGGWCVTMLIPFREPD
jgi:signal transduction histidine kinase